MPCTRPCFAHNSMQPFYYYVFLPQPSALHHLSHTPMVFSILYSSNTSMYLLCSNVIYSFLPVGFYYVFLLLRISPPGFSISPLIPHTRGGCILSLNSWLAILLCTSSVVMSSTVSSSWASLPCTSLTTCTVCCSCPLASPLSPHKSPAHSHHILSPTSCVPFIAALIFPQNYH